MDLISAFFLVQLQNFLVPYFFTSFIQLTTRIQLLAWVLQAEWKSSVCQII